MDFSEKYTTEDKIKGDLTGKEILKVKLTNDAFAVSELLSDLILQIQRGNEN